MGKTHHGARSASTRSAQDPEQSHGLELRPRELLPSPRIVDDEERARLERVSLFSQWLAAVVPVNLIPSDVAEMLQHRANSRFDMARAQGVPLEQIYFGQDCLPTWDTQYWDPEEESLHDILQERLCDLERALQLSTLLQHELQKKSNGRMKEARELGIHLDAIAVGPSLLPEWRVGLESADTWSAQTSTLAAGLGGGCSDEEADVSAMSLASDDEVTPETSFADDVPGEMDVTDAPVEDKVDLIGYASSGDSEILDELFENSADLTGHAVSGTAHLRQSVLKRKRDPESSDSTSEEEYESSDAEQEDTDDIYLNNHVSPQPIYDDYAGSNILHDVEIVGIPGEAPSLVDLEVYLAVDDDDYDDDDDDDYLAQVELAIDREAYERCYGDDGAIDVHIPGAEIFCFSRTEELDRDEDGEDEGERSADSSDDESMRDVFEQDSGFYPGGEDEDEDVELDELMS
ncbi:hypothetical protein E4U21_002382 [Claviceps maximensis]|nr:hypothetical protein E4U21_002382 [Claviceps maximensis]